MTNINFLDEVARQITFLFTMLEGVHSTRIGEMLDEAYPNVDVIGQPRKLSMKKYWICLRASVLRKLKCTDVKEPSRVLIELLCRRLIHVEDVPFMMKSQSIFFTDYPPFLCWEHYDFFLDIQELVITYMYGSGPGFRKLTARKSNLFGPFFPSGEKNKRPTFISYAMRASQSIELMYRDLQIQKRRGLFHFCFFQASLSLLLFCL